MTRKPVVVPFNRPYLAGRELQHIKAAVDRGHASGDGWYTARCSEMLRERTGSRQVLLTTSCTHALEMSALLLEVGPGDEVLMPSFTFVSTANAFTLRGARPVFVDIRPDTLNLDETLLEGLITARTKAIVVVHYAGVACEMDEIMTIARRHDLPVVEDNAHGLAGTYREAPLGSFGKLATLSFHETKNFQCGEGGALLVNDPSLSERAEILREKGTNRSQFFRGQVDKYTWMDQGSSYLPSDLLAAYLLGQLESFDDIQHRRTSLWDTYASALSGWAEQQGIRLPIVPDHCRQPGHLFYLLLSGLEERTAFIKHMSAHGVMAVFHYVPLHTSPQGQLLAPASKCPVTEDVSERLVRLPLHAGLRPDELELTLEAALSFRR